MAEKDKRLEQILRGVKILQADHNLLVKYTHFQNEYKDAWVNAWYHSMWSTSVVGNYEPESKDKNKECIVLYLAPIDGEDGQFHRPLEEVRAKLPSEYKGCRIFVEHKTINKLYIMRRYMEELCKEPEKQLTEGEKRIARAEEQYRRSPELNDLLKMLA